VARRSRRGGAGRQLLAGLAVDVTGAGGDLEELAIDRSPVLAHEEHRVAVGHSHDAHGAGMTDHVAGETRPVGRLELASDEGDPPPLEADLVGEVTEPLFRRRHRRRCRW